mmetsp:Transcript_11622/g.38243  ORF Transcript_11622/g.38243 Transcript_11622/m.38243 type:complete len:712 (-) Transcript_11622:1499-3634(-)
MGMLPGTSTEAKYEPSPVEQVGTGRKLPGEGVLESPTTPKTAAASPAEEEESRATPTGPKRNTNFNATLYWKRAKLLAQRQQDTEGKTGDKDSGESGQSKHIHSKHLARSAVSQANKRFSIILSEVRQKRPTYTISPYAIKKQVWDWFIIIFVVYNALFIPLSLAFNDQFSKGAELGLFILDTCVDCLFFVDIILSFRTEFPDQHGDPVQDGTLIARNYLKSWFWVDLVATIPFDAIGSLFTSSGSHTGAFGLLKTIRLFRLGRLFKKLEQIAAANALRIVKLMFTYLMCVHWFACMWFFIGEKYQSKVQANQWTGERWTVVHNVVEADLKTQYGTSFHYALTCILPGASNVVPGTNTERNFSDVVMVAGALMNAFVFGNVAALIQSFDHMQSKYTEHAETINAFTTHFAVPQSLKQRMQAYFENMWTILGGFDVRDVTKSLPRRLQYDVYSHIYSSLVTHSRLFKDCDKGFVRMLLSRLTPVFVVPNEVLVGQEDPVNEMFFILRGVAAVISKDGVVQALLREGDPVGHIALLQGERRRTANVQAVEMLELARLDRKDFEECLAMYPDHRELLHNYAKQELGRLKSKARQQKREMDGIEPAASTPREVEEIKAIEENMESPVPRGASQPGPPRATSSFIANKQVTDMLASIQSSIMEMKTMQRDQAQQLAALKTQIEKGAAAGAHLLSHSLESEDEDATRKRWANSSSDQ